MTGRIARLFPLLALLLAVIARGPETAVNALAPTSTASLDSPRATEADATCSTAVPTGASADKRAIREAGCRERATGQARPGAPTPTATTIPATATAIAALSPCRAGGLSVMWWGPGNGAMQNIYQGFAFWNRGTTACTLKGSPGLHILGPHEEILHSFEPNSTLAGQQDRLGKPAQIVVVLPGLGRPGDRDRGAAARRGYAFVELVWGTHLIREQRACPTPTPPAVSARLILPDDGGAMPFDFKWNGCGIGSYPFWS